ncbi:LysR family transcriptional regulator [Acidisoma sp. L85]|jgi:DNA-binding transcriptional LysR family regulator|uniref:LysR family transcriptional regulator n=1 Tax=Acidisoma sp. L85 TaxID=1641850 RepID=UPI00131D042B|nr:LysR family transcriptional regulator [Acidisoma sp. L85]
MRPTFAQLEAFYWVSRLGSLKEAARHLGLAPPTISLRIDQLEAELGSPVFERAGRGLILTQRGETMVPRVASVMEEYDKIRSIVDDNWQHSGVLRIGVPETFAQACLSDYMRIIAARYPALRLEFAVSTSSELEQDVLHRRLDIAFAINPTGDPKLTLVPLGIQPVVWAAAPRFNLPSPLHPSDLRGIVIITNPPPTPMWRQITEWFRQAGLEPHVICRCSSPTVVAQLVSTGLGASLLPRRLVQKSLAAGILRSFESALPLHPSRLFAIYRFADSDSITQEVIALARHAMAQTRLVEPEEN